MPPYKVKKLLQAWKKHQMSLQATFDSFSGWCTGFKLKLSEEERVAVIAAKEQLETLYSHRLAEAIAAAFRRVHVAAIEFIVDNSLDLHTFHHEFVSSDNPVLAPFYAPGTSDRSEYITQRLHTVLHIPQFVQRLQAASEPVQEAFLQRIIHFLPHSAPAATALKRALDCIGDALKVYHITLLHIPYLGWTEHLADVVFAHPATRKHFYTQHAPEYAAKAAELLSWHELSQRSLMNYKAFDKRAALERKKIVAASWRALFWGAIVLQWRKRDFVERYYGPDGAGTRVAEERFYKSIAKEIIL
jgi:hypothetical protein